MKKACLSVLLICCFLLQSVFVTTASARTVVEQDVEIVVELGLMRGDENGDLRLNDTVTRAEFTALALRLMGLEEMASSHASQVKFSDVSADHWACGEIYLASELGIINGVGNNLFEPERPVSQNEAIKIVICALGYGPLAIHMGDEFPATYINLATKFKLLKGLNGSGEFTRGYAAVLLKNALTVDIMDGLGKVITGNTVLKRYLDVDAMQGFVTGTELTNSDKQIKPGYIEIEGKIYRMRQKATEELFGCEVKFYLSEDENGNDIIYYIEPIENDRRLVIPSEDILSSTSINNLCYNVNGASRDVRLADGLTIYYNGKKAGSADRTAQLLKPKQGEVILCDKEGDSIYDAAIVTDYQSVVVKYVNQDMIYDVYQNNVTLDPDATVSISRGGKEISIDEIKAGDVLSVAKSLDSQIIRIIADSQMITGYISDISLLKTGTFYGIITEYGEAMDLQISNNYQVAVANGLSQNVLQVDKQLLNIWVDAFDKIAYAEVAEVEVITPATMQYGYILDAGVRKGFDDIITLKILNESNKIEVYTLSDKLLLGRNIAGVYTQRNTASADVLTALGGVDNLNRQLVQFRADETGMIKRLYLADNPDNRDVISEDVPREVLNYRQGVLGQKYFVDDSTIVFSIPADGRYEDVVCVAKPSGVFSEGWTSDCTLYDVVNGHVGVVVVHDKVNITYNSSDMGYKSTISYGGSPFLYISNSSRRMDEDGEFYLKIEGNQNGNAFSHRLSEELADDYSVVNQLTRGSLIQYATNSNLKSLAKTASDREEIVAFEKIFDFEQDMGSGIRWNHSTAYDTAPEIITLWGTLKTIDPAFCSVEVDTGDEMVSYPLRFLSNTVFMEYDSANYEFKTIRHEQLSAGQRVFIVKQSSCMNVVVY